MFNVLIISKAESVDYETFEYTCAFYLQNKVKTDQVTILTIGSDNVEKFCNKYRIATMDFPSEWNLYGANAAKVRNQKILKVVNAAIVFLDDSKDTCTLVAALKDNNIPIKILENKNN